MFDARVTGLLWSHSSKFPHEGSANQVLCTIFSDGSESFMQVAARFRHINNIGSC